VKPRRFAQCLEFDRAGDLRDGTDEQQAQIRKEMDQFLSFNNPLDLTMRAVDRAINRWGFHYVRITFDIGYVAHANPTTIYLNYTFEPELITQYFWHELGHVVGMDVFNPQDRTEQFAEEFKLWVYNGTPEDYAIWERLRPVVA
jgi:hypothetical protein